MCEAKKQIGDHRCDDLQTNGVIVLAHELFEIEMLLDPAEQELDLPAALVEGRNLDRRAFEIVGDEGDHSTFVTSDLDASQWDRQLGVALTGEHDFGIVDDAEAVTLLLANVAGLCLAQVRAYLDTRNEEGLGSADLYPPAKVIIALVENVGCPGFEFGLTADFNVVDGRGRNPTQAGTSLPG